MAALSVPSWQKQLCERIAARQLSERGFAGMLEHLPAFDRLGAALADGTILPAQLDEFVSNVTLPAEDPMQFWHEFYLELCGEELVDVPQSPHLTPKMRAAAEEFGFMPMYMPSELTEELVALHLSAYGKIWFGRNVELKCLKDGVEKVEEGDQPESDFERYVDPTLTKPALPGRWVLIEKGCADGSIALNRALGIEDRSLGIYDRGRMSQEAFSQIYAPQVSKLFGVSSKATRLPSYLELFLALCVFVELKVKHGARTHNFFTGSGRDEWVSNTAGEHSTPCAVKKYDLGSGMSVWRPRFERVDGRRFMIVLPHE